MVIAFEPQNEKVCSGEEQPVVTATETRDSQPRRTRIVILGGGFGGVYTAHHLEKLCRRRPDVEIVLASCESSKATAIGVGILTNPAKGAKPVIGASV
jgi:hypothetical protein